jgi:Flp pilus assembly pilin Flp
MKMRSLLELRRGFSSRTSSELEEQEMHSTQFIDLKKFLQRSQRGQDLAEYGLLIGFIAIAVVVGVTILGQQLTGLYQFIVTQLSAIF